MGNASNAPLRSRLRLGSFSSTSVSRAPIPGFACDALHQAGLSLCGQTPCTLAYTAIFATV
jgi:hypothetical protein